MVSAGESVKQWAPDKQTLIKQLFSSIRQAYQML